MANIKINFENDNEYTSRLSITVYGNNEPISQTYELNEFGKYKLDNSELVLSQKGCEFEKVSPNKNDAVYRALLSRCEEPTIDKFKILEFTDSKISMTQNFSEKYQCEKIN